MARRKAPAVINPALFSPGLTSGVSSPLDEDMAASQQDMSTDLSVQNPYTRKIRELQMRAGQAPAFVLPPAAAAPKGSGKTNVSSGTRRDAYTETAKVPIGYQPQQLMPFYEAIKQLPEYQDYANGLKQEADTTDLLSRMPTQVDLSPVMAFADYLAPGGTAQKGYARPESAASRIKGITDRMDRVQDNKRDMIKHLTTILGLGKGPGMVQGNYTTDIKLNKSEKVQDPAIAAGKAGPDRRLQMEMAYAKPLTKINQDFTQAKQLLDNIEADISSGSWGRAMGTLSQFAALAGEKAAKTEGDIARQFPAMLGKKLADITTFFNSNPDMPIDAKAQDFLHKKMRDLKKAAADRFEIQTRDLENTYNSMGSTKVYNPEITEMSKGLKEQFQLMRKDTDSVVMQALKKLEAAQKEAGPSALQMKTDEKLKQKVNPSRGVRIGE